jgi:protein-S-isoprenylcysteine O-methyltransferase Ste14
MHPLALAVGYAWLVFWIYWLVSASTSKESVRGGWRTRLTGVSAVGVFVIAVVLHGGSLAVHSVILAAIGAALFACGIALVVWARLHLGRNWGMPTTQRAEPELVTSGPYRYVRHDFQKLGQPDEHCVTSVHSQAPVSDGRQGDILSPPCITD